MKSGTPFFRHRTGRLLLFSSFLILISPALIGSEQRLWVQPAERAVSLTGYSRSRKTITLSSEVSGKVLKVNYDIGQAIGKAPFLLVDTTFVDLEIESSNRALERLEVSRKRQLSRIAFLDKELRRILSLFQKGGTTEQKQDASAEELNQARLELESIDVETAATRIRLKEQQERRIRHALNAPKGWIVTQRHIEEGELITAGAPVAHVSDFKRLVVPFSVSAEELSAFQRLSPEFDVILSGLPTQASINWINPRFDEKTRKLEMELLIRNFDGQKRGGLKCRIPLQVRADGVRVPKAAVLNRYENPLVFLSPKGNAIPIFILGDSDDHFLIADDPHLPPHTELMSPEKRQKMKPNGDQRPKP